MPDLSDFSILVNNFNLLLTLLTIVVVFAAVQGFCAYQILMERKISAWMQDRKGPNRVGPFGLLQPIADGIKFLLKEELVPKHVDKLFYMIAPCIAVSTALLALAIVPVGPTTAPPVDRPGAPMWPQTVEQEKALAASPEGQQLQTSIQDYHQSHEYVIAPTIDLGIVFIFAVGSLNVYAIILGGWSSNNKYSMLGALRASAQVISYEIPLGMSVLSVALLAGSLNMETIIDYQVRNGAWNIWFHPLACLLFITAIFAECNRLPFDLPECEQELVGGYHTEYSGMKFAMYFLGEYTHMVTTSFLVMVLFFGGWTFMGLESWLGGWGDVIMKILILSTKMVLFIVFYMLIRWTIPRFRFDQLMSLAWKVMIPLSIANLLLALFVKQFNLDEWVLGVLSLAILVGSGIVALRLPKKARDTLAVRTESRMLETVAR